MRRRAKPPLSLNLNGMLSNDTLVTVEPSPPLKLPLEKHPHPLEPLSLSLIHKLLYIYNHSQSARDEFSVSFNHENKIRNLFFGERHFLLKPIKELGAGQFGNVKLYYVLEIINENPIHELPIAIKYLAYDSREATFSEVWKHLSVTDALNDKFLVPALGKLPHADALVLPYYTEGSLADWQQTFKPISSAIKLSAIHKIIHQVARTLHALHSNTALLEAFGTNPDNPFDTTLEQTTGPIIYGDLKLENIFIDQSNNAHLGDLGCIETIERLRQMKKFENGTFYMHAPEMFTIHNFEYELNETFFKLDVWTLGIIIKQLLNQPKPNQAPIKACEQLDREDKLCTLSRHAIFQDWATGYDQVYLTYLVSDAISAASQSSTWQSLNALANCCLAPTPYRPTTSEIITPDVNWIKRLTVIQSKLMTPQRKAATITRHASCSHQHGLFAPRLTVPITNHSTHPDLQLYSLTSFGIK